MHYKALITVDLRDSPPMSVVFDVEVKEVRDK